MGTSRHIHLVGFGSQGTAWAELLRAAGWDVAVSLGRREGASYERATASGFRVQLVHELATALASELNGNQSTEPALVVMATPDHLIAPLYRECLARVARPITLVLIHGYAVYSKALSAFTPGHEPALLAPKAIGPKLLAAGRTAAPATHDLVAGFSASPERAAAVERVARDLGFSRENLVAATFEQEAIGDLISEQTLLCGGVFNLIEWTFEAMKKAGVPDRLIREECLTELDLIAGLIRERGVAATLSKISQAAQSGTIAMRTRLERAGIPAEIEATARDIVDRSFVDYFDRGEWRVKLQELESQLERLEKNL